MGWSEDIFLWKKNHQNIILFDVVFRKGIIISWCFEMRYYNNNGVLLLMRKLRGGSTCLWVKLMRSVVTVLNFGCQVGLQVEMSWKQIEIKDERQKEIGLWVSIKAMMVREPSVFLPPTTFSLPIIGNNVKEREEIWN